MRITLWLSLGACASGLATPSAARAAATAASLRSVWNGEARLDSLDDGARAHVELCAAKGFDLPSDDGPLVASAEDVLSGTKRWTRAMIADFQVCPFTADESRAGLPRGAIRYEVSEAKETAEAFAAFWREVETMLSDSLEAYATGLLVLPRMFEDVAEFEAFAACLDESLIGAGLCEELQLVYFHPKWMFKDSMGMAVLIFDEETGEPLGLSTELAKPIDFARRSPWPMINLLRSPQVNRIQRGIPQYKVFDENVGRLDQVGVRALQGMLDRRDWSDLPKVTRDEFYQKVAENAV